MKHPCLARKDPVRGYSDENCYWREALTATEARFHIEDWEWTASELDQLPLTFEEDAVRDQLPDGQKLMFDVWKRMLMRADVLRETK
jgi:hypothetical protein